MNESDSTDVLVVGGRTTGMMLAARLARQGINVRIVDGSPGIDIHSRATLLHSRSLELLDNLGIADEMVSKGQPLRGMHLFFDGQAVMQTSDPPVDSPHPYGISYSQAQIEGMLEAKLGSFGVTVERGTEFVGLDQDDACVRARLRHRDGSEETVEAAYMVGCDGAHSATRHMLGIGFPGTRSRYPYMLADVIADNDEPADAWFLFLHSLGAIVFAILNGRRRQIIAPLPEDHPAEGEPELAELQSMIDLRTGGSYRLRDPLWLAYFRINYRVAERFRDGRVFLAGDAAHVHSPFAGHGMNTGIQDACNLAWKLTLAIRGVASPALLDSYDAERRPVAQGVVENTRTFTESVENYPSMTAGERDSFLNGFRREGDELTAFRRSFEELDLDYGASPIGRDDAADLPEDVRPGLEARNVAGLLHGDEGCDLFRFLGGPHHCLLVFAGMNASPEAARARAREAHATYGPWMDVHLVLAQANNGNADTDLSVLLDRQAALTRRYGMEGAGIYLFRPDGHVAYRTHRLDGLKTYVDTVLNAG